MPDDELVRSSSRRGEMFIADGPAPGFFTPAGDMFIAVVLGEQFFHFRRRRISNVCLNLLCHKLTGRNMSPAGVKHHFDRSPQAINMSRLWSEDAPSNSRTLLRKQDLENLLRRVRREFYFSIR
jgi:hypothetical protein